MKSIIGGKMLSLLNSGLNGIFLVAIIAAFLFALIISFGFHEWAHAYVATKQGDPTPKALGRLTLNPLAHLDPIGTVCLLLIGFGWAKPVPVNPMNFKNYRKGMFLVSIAGVSINLIMAIVFSFLYVLFTGVVLVDVSTAIGFFFIQFLLYSTIISFTLAIFNLLPIYPLDGFQALRSFTRYDNQFFRFMEQYGMVILIIFLISPLFDYVFEFAYSIILSPLFQLWQLILV